MKVRNHKLLGDDGSAVSFQQTPNTGGKLKNGKPQFLIMHFTAGASADGAIRWFMNPDAKASAHLVIGQDGAITQMARFDDKAWHAGRSTWNGISGLNSHSVGIEIANWGLLKGSAGNYRSWTGAKVPDERVMVAAHKHTPSTPMPWEVYTEDQMEASTRAAAAIVQAYDIPPENVIGHEDISRGRKVDPGPLFDLNRFRDRVFGRSEDGDNDFGHYVVAARSGLNLRKGPGIHHEVIENLPDGSAVRAIEQDGAWWLVAKIAKKREDTTGYVHSNWLRPA